MEMINLQVGAARVRDALKALNRKDRLSTIRILFPDMDYRAAHKLCDNIGELKLKSGTQIAVPGEWLEVA